MSDARLDALRAAADAGARLLRGTTSGRLALAGLHGTLDPALIPVEVRQRAVAEIADAAARSCVALRPRDVQRALRDAWGAPPDDVLDALDPNPVALTPGAVVHRAVHDGADVAVKVLRPGIAEAVRSDLALADALVRPLGAALPGIDAAALLREVRERVLDELDLEHEASTQRAFARALRRHDALHVPAPVMELCRERVLVSAWVDGTPVGALTDPAQRSAAARLLVRFFAGAARFGTVHADPHPSDALLMADGRLAIVDFGAARRVQPARVDLALEALAALRGGDDGSTGGGGAATGGAGAATAGTDAFGAALAALGWLPADVGPDAAALARELLGDLLAGPARLDTRRLAALGEDAADQAPRIAALAARATLSPEDLWPLRMLGALMALVARLDPAPEDWPALVASAAREGW